MVKQKFTTNDKNNFVIKFPRTVGFLGFERILRERYTASKRYEKLGIIFDLEDSKWINLMQLSMIAQWIIELKNLQKEVSVKMPASVLMCSFLDNYAFTHFLAEHKISANRPDKIVKTTLTLRPYLPLTFASASVFRDILARLNNSNYYSSLFKEVEYFNLVNRGTFRDVIIKELVDNMEYHGANILSNIIVTKLRDFDSRREVKVHDDDELNMIIDRESLVVVVGDKGPGIPNKLLKIYNKDMSVFSENKNPSKSKIIEYATLEHVTSRSPEERLAALKRLLNELPEDLNPFTGLFQLRQEVKKYLGILTIRSADSFVVFNYYKEKGKEIIYSNETVTNFKTLASFGGTQIQVCLPIMDDFQIIEENIYGKILKTEIDENPRYKYIPIIDYFIYTTSESEILAGWQKLLNEIISSSASTETDFIILDFNSKQIAVETKIKTVLIYTLMKRQEVDNKIHTIVNIDPLLIKLSNEWLENRKGFLYKPIVVFDTSHHRDLIGASDHERLLHNKILHSETFSGDPEEMAFIDKHTSLFSPGKIEGDWLVRHNRQNILYAIRKQSEEYVETYIRDEKNKVFYPEIKVMAPNTCFFDKYYEIYTLMQNEKVRNKILTLIELEIQDSRPEYVISINVFMGEAIEEVIRNSSIKSVYTVKHFCLPTLIEINKSDFLNNIKLTSTSTVLVYTDVIATGKSLIELINHLRSGVVKGICAIVNLMGSNELVIDDPLFKIPLKAILNDTATHFISKPFEWDYGDIFSVENETRRLVKPYKLLPNQQGKSFFKSPMAGYWIEKAEKKITTSVSGQIGVKNIYTYSNPFFENLILPNFLYEIKSVSEKKYYPIKYDIKKAINVEFDAVIKDLLDNLIEAEKKYKISFSHLLTIGRTEIYSQLFTSIYSERPGIIIRPISYNLLLFQDNSFDLSGRAVVVMDDVFSSGDNFFKILEFCESHNAAFVFVYIFVKHADNRLALRLKNIKEFGAMKVEFHYLFDGGVPIYSGTNNAPLKQIKEYRALRSIFENVQAPSFLSFIDSRITLLSGESETIEEESIERPLDSYAGKYMRLRWKVELARNDMDTRKEIAFYFENRIANRTDILLLFGILTEEKDTFLRDDTFLDNFFYKVFRTKVIETIQQYLGDKRLALSDNDILNCIEVFMTLDREIFLDFIDQELYDMVTKKEIIYSFVFVFCNAQSDRTLLNFKLKFISVLDQIKNKKITLGNDVFAVAEQVKTMWKNEALEYAGIEFKRVVLIKDLIGIHFHDLAQQLDSIEKATHEKRLEIFKHMLETVYKAKDDLDLLFMNDDFNVVEQEISQNIKELVEASSDGLSHWKSYADEKLDNENLKDYIGNCLTRISLLLFKDKIGIIKVLDKRLRREFKEEIVVYIGNKMEALGKHVEYVKWEDDACTVFCLDNNLRSIVSNIAENIRKHSQATKVKIYLKRIKEEDSQYCVLDVYENGCGVENIIEGYGIRKCKDFCKNHAGEFIIQTTSEEDPNYALNFKTHVRVKLHFLAPATEYR